LYVIQFDYWSVYIIGEISVLGHVNGATLSKVTQFQSNEVRLL